MATPTKTTYEGYMWACGLYMGLGFPWLLAVAIASGYALHHGLGVNFGWSVIVGFCGLIGAILVALLALSESLMVAPPTLQPRRPGGGRPRPADCDDDALYGVGAAAFAPMVNIDGSPMVGDVDIHGNPFGVTSHAMDSSDMHHSDSYGGHSTLWDGPSVNIDGSPMMGSVDIHGNAFGFTQDFGSHDPFNNS